MSRFNIALLVTVLTCPCVLGQTTASVGEIKIRAESGDPIAQDKLGESYLSSFYFADAVKCFRAAAEKGVVNSQWRLGQILLDGSSGFPQRSTAVAADPKQAIRWLTKASATGHTAAQRDLARCFEKGKGVTKNNVEAYKWLGIAAKSDPIVAKTYRDQLALKMSAAEIQEADRRIASFVAGVMPSVWEQVHLKGISGSAQRRLAIINRTTVEAGEKFSLNLDGENVEFTCEKITERSVIISNATGVRELTIGDQTPR